MPKIGRLELQQNGNSKTLLDFYLHVNIRGMACIYMRVRQIDPPENNLEERMFLLCLVRRKIRSTRAFVPKIGRLELQRN